MYTAIVILDDNTEFAYKPMNNPPTYFDIKSDVEGRLRNYNDFRQVKSINIIVMENELGGYSRFNVYNGRNQQY